MKDIKEKWKIKEELTELAKKNASNQELLKFMKDKGYNPVDIMDYIKELIHNQLGTDVNRPNDDNIKLVMIQMMEYGLDSEKMWEYLEEFKVPPQKRIEIIKEVKQDIIDGKITIKRNNSTTFPKRKYTDEEISENRIDENDRLICTMCGTDCSKLKRADRKCPSCDYHMIKIMRDTVIKQGLASKEEVIQKLVESDLFTDEEKDMIR